MGKPETRITGRLVRIALILAACLAPACATEIGDGFFSGQFSQDGAEIYASGIWSGVPFTAVQVAVVLDIANHASFVELDDDARLHATAARNIVARRPIANMLALDAVPYVGAIALTALRAYVSTWNAANPDAELLEFVNHPSVDAAEIDQIIYIAPTHASAIIAYRATNAIDSVDELRTASALHGASPLADYQVESLSRYAGPWQPPGPNGGDAPGTWEGIVFSGTEVTVVLEIANTATVMLLDDKVGLNATAARNIVGARPLTTMGELDAVPYVGTQAFQRFKAYVPTWSLLPGPDPDPDPDPEPDPDPSADVTTSGVTFAAAEAVTVLDMVNNASEKLLDDDVGLDGRAATNIVGARPIADLAALDAVPYVGASALNKLKDYASQWQPAPPPAPGGTYDGVDFTAAQETVALEISNRATAEQLSTGGVSGTPSRILRDNRPWASLAAVAAYSGIGPATMAALFNMVPGWDGIVTAPTDATVQLLADEAASAGVSSPYFDTVVTVSRAVITSTPYRTSNGVSFWVADPQAGNQQQLKVYIAAAANQETTFATIFDDVRISGRFTQYGTIFELLLDDAGIHDVALNKGGVDYSDYAQVQAAWHSTSANPEGVLRISSSLGYTYKVPLPVFKDHPMWNGTPPGSPSDSGNEQDHNWNIAAQNALDDWLASGG